jgi:citrate lyase subunit beta/citryl-CoA lyase
MTWGDEPPPRVSRSTLILPVHVERFVSSVWRRGADNILLDLEDSVAPDAKAEARAAVRAAIPIAARGGATVSVRVNHDTWEEDITAALWPGVSGITFPKAESAEEVRAVSALLDRLEPERDIEPGSTRLSPAIETVAGYVHAAEIAQASPRVGGVGGPAGVDFAVDLGFELDASLDQLEPARGALDLLGRSLGGRGGGRWHSGQAITEYGDEDRFTAAARVSRRNGGRGSAGIHPSVIVPFNRGYSPSSEEIEEARAITEEVAAAWAAGLGSAIVNGRRVSARNARAARDLAAYGEACRALDEQKQRTIAEAGGTGEET